MNTAVMGATPALERYLKRATFGLSDPHRQAVWDELEEHILTRQDGYCLIGHDPDTALQLAMRELGPALRVSAGMNRVHNMAGIVAAALGLTLVLGAAAYAVAQQPDYVLTVKDNVPLSSTCAIFDNPNSVQEYRKHETNRVTQIGEQTCVEYGTGGGAAKANSLLELSQVEQLLIGRPLKTSITSGPNSFFRIDYDLGGSSELRINRGYGGKNYLDVGALIPIGLPELTLHSYSRPVLTLGKKRIGFDAPNAEASRSLYGSYAFRIISALVGGTDHWNIGWVSDSPDSLESHPHALSVNTLLTEDEAVVIITNIDRTNPGNRRNDKTKNVLDYQVAPVGRGGKVELQSRFKPLQFVKTLAELKPAKGHGAATALMVRLTGTRMDEIEKAIILPNSR